MNIREIIEIATVARSTKDLDLKAEPNGEFPHRFTFAIGILKIDRYSENLSESEVHGLSEAENIDEAIENLIYRKTYLYRNKYVVASVIY
jgi:hypothetical protein